MGGFSPGGFGALFEGQAKKGDFDAKAKVARLQAAQAESRGRSQVSLHRERVNRLIGTQAAAAAGSNILVDDGIAAEIQVDTAFVGERDAIQIRNNAALEAWQFRTSAASFSAAADNAETIGKINALSEDIKFAAAVGGAGGAA